MGDSNLIRLNGGLGEPALPNTRSILSGFRSPLEMYSSDLGRDGSPSRPFVIGDSNLIRFNGGLGEPALPEAACEPSLDF
jgi:hypothetical protein